MDAHTPIIYFLSEAKKTRFLSKAKGSYPPKADKVLRAKRAGSYMQSYVKKILLSLFVIFIVVVFTTLLFWGTKNVREYLASFFGVITAKVTINPLEVEVYAPGVVEINKVFQVRAKAINKGEERIENARGEIYLPEGLVLLRKDSVKKIGIIPPKKEKKMSWSVKGVKEGSYIITVSVSGELRENLVIAEGTAKVDVKRKLSPQVRLFEWLRNFFQQWSNF